MSEKDCKCKHHHIPEEVREHAKAARDEMRKGFESLMPKEFVAHRKAARKEMLMAARTMLDKAIDKLEVKEA